MEQLTAGAVSTAYVRSGDGPPLVLIHGGEADHSMFNGLRSHLEKRFTVIAYDQRDSGKTINPAEEYSLADLGDDAAALIRGLGYSRAHVMGTSLGGLIAQALAARHGDVIDRLVLSSTWLLGKSPMEVNAEVFRTLAAYRANMAENAPKIATYFFPKAYIEAHPEVIDIFRGSTRDAGQTTRRRSLTGKPIEADLSSFKRPTLLMAGGEDRLIPNTATFAIAERIAHARRVVIPGVGHVSSIQAPHRVGDAIAGFLLSASA